MNLKPLAAASFAVALTLSLAAQGNDSMGHSADASLHSSMAVKEAITAGAHFVAGSVAVPLMVSGAAGALSAGAGDALWQTSQGRARDPLPVGEETYLSLPSPDQAIRR